MDDQPHTSLHHQYNSEQPSRQGKIIFLRRASIDTDNPVLDIIPGVILQNFLPDSNYIPSINNQNTLELVVEREQTIDFSQIDIIFTPESTRCKHTANLVQAYIKERYHKDIPREKIFLLQEVKFRIDKLLPSFFEHNRFLDINKIDLEVLKATLGSQYCEPISETFWRIEYLFRLLQNYRNKNVLIIGHEYFLRLMQAYITHRGNPNMSLSELLKTQKIFPLAGIETNFDLEYLTFHRSHHQQPELAEQVTPNAQNTDLFFLRRDSITIPYPNLDILPTPILHEMKLVDKDRQIRIDEARTLERIKERNVSLDFSQIDIIFSAQSGRCAHTAKSIQKYINAKFNKQIEINFLYLLDEVIFRIDKIIPGFQEDYQILDPQVVDAMIMEHIFNAKWSESINQIFWRLEYLFSLFQKEEYKHKKIVIIGHEYIMRITQLYIAQKNKSEKLDLEYFMHTHKCFPLHGFATDKQATHIKALPLPSFVTNGHKNKNIPEIHFIRHSKTELPFSSHDDMPQGVIHDLTLASLDPDIDKYTTSKLIEHRNLSLPLEKINVIFTAPSVRSKSTASMIQEFIFNKFQKKVEVITLPYLAEVQFNIEKIHPAVKDKEAQIDIHALNQDVFKAMILGLESESLKQCYWKIEILMNILQNYKDRKNILVITHGYFMRALELFIKNKSYDMVTFDDLNNAMRANYLQGFETDFDFSFINYLSSVDTSN